MIPEGRKYSALNSIPTIQKQVIDINWNEIIEKIKKKISKLKYRDLFLQGKVTYINTLRLSKVWCTLPVSIHSHRRYPEKVRVSSLNFCGVTEEWNR